AEEIERVLRRQRGLVGLDIDLGIDRGEPVARRLQLRPSDIGRAVQDLPVQVAEVDGVEVDDAEAADAGGGEIERGGGAGGARADAQHACRLQPPLTVDAHLRHDQVPAVALDFFRRQLGRGDRLAYRRGARHRPTDVY